VFGAEVRLSSAAAGAAADFQHDRGLTEPFVP
jgi:hypothetical protein